MQRALPLALPLALLALWQAASMLGLAPARILPAPSAVLEAGWRLGASGELAHHLWVSAGRALLGLAIGGGVGFALGLANGLSRLSLALTDSTVQMLRNVPHLALIPLAIIWFGVAEGARVFLVALGVFFPLYINTLHGVRSVDPQLLEMGRVYGMSPARLFWRVVAPGALPSILVGVRYALGVMWLTLVVAEAIAADAGLGHLAMQAREFLRTDIVVLCILIYALLGKLADSLTRMVEQRALRWNPAYAGA